MTPPTETRAVTIHVSERAFAGLIDHGRKAGYTPTLYAQMLFEAAWAARVGKGEDDPLLVACVEKSLVRKPAPHRFAPPIAVAPAAPVPAGPVPELRVVPIPVLVPVPIAVPIVQDIRPAPSIEAMPPVEPPPMPAATPKTSPWSPAQRTFALLVCREEGVSWAEARAALAPAYQGRSSIFALISTVRKRLAVEGVSFEPVDIWGWRVERHCRDAAAAFLGRTS